MKYDEAERMAKEYLRKSAEEYDNDEFMITSIGVKTYGWVFFYHYKKYVESGSELDLILGGPTTFLITKEGKLYEYKTDRHKSVEENLREFELEHNLKHEPEKDLGNWLDDDFDYSKGAYLDYSDKGYKNIIDFKEYASHLINQKVLDFEFSSPSTRYISECIKEYKNSEIKYKMFTSYGKDNQMLILERTNLRFVLLWESLRVGINHLMFKENCPGIPKKSFWGKVFSRNRTEIVSLKKYPEHSFPYITEVLGQRITEIHLLRVKSNAKSIDSFPNDLFPKGLHYYKGNLAVRFTFENGHSIAVGSGLMDTPMYVKGGMLLIPFEMVDQTKVEEMIKIA